MDVTVVAIMGVMEDSAATVAITDVTGAAGRGGESDAIVVSEGDMSLQLREEDISLLVFSENSEI